MASKVKGNEKKEVQSSSLQDLIEATNVGTDALLLLSGFAKTMIRIIKSTSLAKLSQGRELRCFSTFGMRLTYI